ncbi:MAG: hypothetical protein NVSMB56_16960 [Pyrinomonadaceae bacterium]
MLNKTLPRSVTLFIFVFAACVVCAAQNPEVLKVEPPSWWTGSTVNPVRVLVQEFSGRES